jgi:uncharacterized membrane protein YbhN (UPF0104 family)
VLALTGLLFLALRLQEYKSQLDWSALAAWQWAALAGLSLVYGASNLLLVAAWRDLLALAGHKTSAVWAFEIYGKSQVAKYMPGNIFHLAGRQALGMASGAPPAALAKSIFWELVLLACAGACVACFSLPLVWPGMTAPLATGIAAIVLIAGLMVVRNYCRRGFASALLWQIVFLAAAGFLFAVILTMLGAAEHRGVAGWIQVVGAYALAWLAGFVMPGAPAGIGIREAVLILLLGGTVSEGGLLTAVVLSRAVTATGDMLFFAASSLPFVRRHQPA